LFFWKKIIKIIVLGIIRKQSISGTIYSYIGVFLGFIISGLLMPKILETDEIGLLRVLVSYSVLIAQFASLGVNTVAVKIFPTFRNPDKNHHGFLSLALITTMAGFIVSVIVYLSFRTEIIESSAEKSALFIPYFYYIIPLVFFTILFNVFDTYYRVLYNAVKGIVFKELVQRLLILIAILLYYFEIVTFKTLVVLYVLALISPSILLLINLIKDRQLHLKPDFNFIDKDLSKRIISIGLFGIITSFSGVLVMNIDIIMVNRMLGLSETGVYTVTFFFGSMILVPLRTMGKIGSVVIADAWQKNDILTIQDIYKKSSISLSVIGVLLFIGIWGNIDNIFQIISDKYLAGKFVILFIGLASLTDITLGVASHIIFNSKYYKYLSYFLLVFVVLLITTNLLLIPEYGIVGAAMASLVSKAIFNGIKYIFLYKKFKLQPFTPKHLILLFIGIISLFTAHLISQSTNIYVDIFIRSSVIILVYSSLVYMFKISSDINNKINEIMNKFKI